MRGVSHKTVSAMRSSTDDGDVQRGKEKGWRWRCVWVCRDVLAGGRCGRVASSSWCHFLVVLVATECMSSSWDIAKSNASI